MKNKKMNVKPNSNSIEYNLNDSNNYNDNDNCCSDEKQQHHICDCKKLDLLNDKIDCLQRIVMNLRKDFLSSNNNSKISQINYINRGWRS